jgi:hypothetical protein
MDCVNANCKPDEVELDRSGLGSGGNSCYRKDIYIPTPLLYEGTDALSSTQTEGDVL